MPVIENQSYRNLLDTRCNQHLEYPNLNNPCICLLDVNEIYVGTTNRIWVRVKKSNASICDESDFLEITGIVDYPNNETPSGAKIAVKIDGSRVVDLLKLSGSTTTKAQITLANGVDKISPSNGDIWRVNNNIFAFLNGVKYRFNLTDINAQLMMIDFSSNDNSFYIGVL